MGERTDYDLLRSRLESEVPDAAPRGTGRRLWPALAVLGALVAALVVALGPGTGYAFAPVTDFEVPMAASLPDDGAELRSSRWGSVRPPMRAAA